MDDVNYLYKRILHWDGEHYNFVFRVFKEFKENGKLKEETLFHTQTDSTEDRWKATNSIKKLIESRIVEIAESQQNKK